MPGFGLAGNRRWVRAVLQRGKRQAPFREPVHQAFGLASGGDVGEADFVSEGGDEGVAAGGEFGGDAFFGGGEAGEDEQATFGQRSIPINVDALRQGAGRTDDDRLRAAQQDAKTFLFHRRMEAADDAASGVAPAGSLVVGGEDDIAGTAGGAEERGLRQCQQVEVAEGGQLGGRSVAQPLAQARWVAEVSRADRDGRNRHGLLVSFS